MGVVAAITYDAGGDAFVSRPILQPLGCDRDGIRAFHQQMLQIHQILGHASKTLVVIHAVVNAYRVGHRQNQRSPVRMLHHGSTGLDAPVLHQQSQRFSQLNLLSTIGCLEIDLGSASQVQGHCIQWKIRIQLANLIACFTVCDEMGLNVKGCIARPG